MDSRYNIIADEIKTHEHQLGDITIVGFDACKDCDDLSKLLIELRSDGFTFSDEECEIVDNFADMCTEKYNVKFLI